MKEKSLGQLGYFDKRSTEEDMPVSPSKEISDKYEHLEGIFEEFFDDNSLTLAKVLLIRNKNISIVQKKKEIKKV